MVGGIMKTARPHAPDAADLDELTEGEWAALEAEYRAKYKKEAADYRKKFGEEPSLGTLIAAEWRAEANDWTDEQREEIHARGMAYYNALITNNPHGDAIRG